jgi:hypothetical protein
MTARSTAANDDPSSVRKVSMVAAPPVVAWRVFTERMGTWWPLAVYKIGKVNAVDAVIEPRVGGRWYERGDDGSTCDWAACSCGNHRRAWCSRGMSAPTGSTIPS